MSDENVVPVDASCALVLTEVGGLVWDSAVNRPPIAELALRAHLDGVDVGMIAQRIVR